MFQSLDCFGQNVIYKEKLNGKWMLILSTVYMVIFAVVYFREFPPSQTLAKISISIYVYL